MNIPRIQLYLKVNRQRVFVQLIAQRTVSLASAVPSLCKMATLPALILTGPRGRKSECTNPGSSDASVNMYYFVSCFDDLSSDATSTAHNVEKQTLKNKNDRRSSINTTLKSELDKVCALPLEPREVDPLK